VGQPEAGVEDVFGDGGEQGCGGGVGVVAAEEVDGAVAGDEVGQVGGGPVWGGGAAFPEAGLEEQAEGLLNGGGGVGGGPVVAGEGGGEESVPVPGRVGVGAEDLAGFGGPGRVRDPAQQPVEGVAGQGGGVEEPGDDLGGFGGVEAGGPLNVMEPRSGLSYSGPSGRSLTWSSPPPEAPRSTQPTSAEHSGPS